MKTSEYDGRLPEPPYPTNTEILTSEVLEDMADVVSKALLEAFRLGQVYWQQADSQYDSHHKRADKTQAQFDDLVDKTRTAILSGV